MFPNVRTPSTNMSAMLRAVGNDFDVDAYMRDCTLPDVTSWRKGDPAFPRKQPEGPRHEWSGVRMEVSAADFDDLAQQTADVVVFLADYAEELRRLRTFPGVESVTLDFGIWRRDDFVQCDHLPASLVRLAGALEMGLELSVYPRDETT